MKKGTFITVVFIAVVGLFFCGIAPKKNISARTEQTSNDYPNMNLIMADGSIRSARNLPGKNIFVIYFPDCDHCQREATEISNHLTAFKNYQVWFIATASLTDIDRFAKQYKLAGHNNFHFVRTNTQDVLNSFGGISTPSLYIYSQERKLVKAFNGETRIEEIIKHL
jgi:peroxiredoxin